VIFAPVAIAGAWIIDIEPLKDARGFFARTWCRRELAAHGLDDATAQDSISWNHTKGTVRGLHFQRAPHEEVKIVRCTQGAIYDVIVDLRPDSPSFKKSCTVELSAENRRALYIPTGCAHGFQTLVDRTEVYYQISTFYVPEASAGYRYDDPAFGIAWPLPVSLINEKDLLWPAFPAPDKTPGA